MLMRRNQKQGIKGAAFDPKVKNYIFSHHPPASAAPPVEFVREAIPAFARRLRATPGKDIWMMGGAGLIASFLDENEIDEFVIHVIPTLIGERHPPDRSAASRRFPTVTFVSALSRRGCASPLCRAQARTKNGPGRQRAA